MKFNIRGENLQYPINIRGENLQYTTNIRGENLHLRLTYAKK